MAASKRRSIRLSIMLVFIALLLVAGPIIRWQISQSVVKKLPKMLGPAQSYSADVSGGLLSLLQGKISRIDMQGNSVKLSTGVTVDKINVQLNNVSFKPDQTVTGVGSTAFTASVSEKNMTDYVAKARPDMQDVRIKLENSRLLLSARPRMLFVRTPVLLEGDLQIVGNTKLWLVLNRLRARGVRTPGFVRGRIMRDLNPVLDTQQVGVPAKLRTVAITSGLITLTGTADVGRVLH